MYHPLPLVLIPVPFSWKAKLIASAKPIKTQLKKSKLIVFEFWSFYRANYRGRVDGLRLCLLRHTPFFKWERRQYGQLTLTFTRSSVPLRCARSISSALRKSTKCYLCWFLSLTQLITVCSCHFFQHSVWRTWSQSSATKSQSESPLKSFVSLFWSSAGIFSLVAEGPTGTSAVLLQLELEPEPEPESSPTSVGAADYDYLPWSMLLTKVTASSYSADSSSQPKSLPPCTPEC